MKLKRVAKYSFEFIVLFVSVTAAFYVENFREEREEKKDLTRYLSGLTDDLRTDSIIYSNATRTLTYSVAAVDSLLEMSYSRRPLDSMGLWYVAKSLLLIYDIGVDNNTNYDALVSSGQLKLVEGVEFRQVMMKYYRTKNVWLRNYESEFQTFRTSELYPFLNQHIDMSDIKWEQGLAVSSQPRTDPRLLESPMMRNYLWRARQFLMDMRNSMKELAAANGNMLKEAQRALPHNHLL